MLTQRNVQLDSGQRDRFLKLHRPRVEDEHLVTRSCEHFALRRESCWVFDGSWHKCGLEDFLLFFRVECKELRFFLGGASAAAAVIAAAPENEAALRLPG